MARLRRLPLTPWWVIGHAAVLLVAALCITLGFWQLDRRQDRQAENAKVRARITRPAPLPAEGFGRGNVPTLRYRGVEATGRYDRDHEFLLRYRSREGLPGYGVITPLVTADGAVLVDRGWVPLDVGERWPAPDAAAPDGEVTVKGWLAAPHRSRSKPAPPIPAQDKPGLVSDVSGPQLAAVLPYDRVYELTLVAEGPEDRFPAPLGLPDISDGPHLGYAFQWFSFAAIGLIGWGALIARATAGRGRSASAPPPWPDQAPPSGGPTTGR